MKRILLIGVLALAGLVGRPASASADITFFLGVNPTPQSRALRGVSAGISLLIVGFEFEYAMTKENTPNALPGLETGMFNALVMTPTNVSLYATAGAGLYRETLGASKITNVGTNVGGGVKIPLFGPLHVRVDYRVFTLRGNAHYKTPQRFYVGVNWPF
jgi:hypothetical protein